MKRVTDTKAAKSISAYLIFKDAQICGKIQVHHSQAKAFCNIWMNGHKVGYGQATGYGYDKEAAAISIALVSMTILDRSQGSHVESCGAEGLMKFGYEVIQAI